MDDSLQPTIDMLLNVAIFMWFGAVCPWHRFVTNTVIPIYRLVPLGILVLLFRRLPMVLAFHWLGMIHQIEDIRHAFFVGFFGPIGVSAVFYLYISREFLADLLPRPDAQKTDEAIEIVVWFLVICSITVHGLSIPLGKVGFYLPRTLSSAISLERTSASQSRAREDETRLAPQREQIGLRPLRRRLTSSERGPVLASPSSISWLPKSFVRAGRHIVNDITRPRDTTTQDSPRELNKKGERNGCVGQDDEPRILSISGPTDPRPIGHAIQRNQEDGDHLSPTIVVDEPDSRPGSGTSTPTGGGRPLRSIQFADERVRPRPVPVRGLSSGTATPNARRSEDG